MADPVAPQPDTRRLLKTFDELVSIPSPVGMTDAICEDIKQRLETLGIEHFQQRRGTVIATLQPAGKPVRDELAIAAHLDTLGVMVEQVKDNGRLALTPIGTWSPRFAEGARASLYTRSGRVIRGSLLPLLASGHAFSDLVNTQPVDWQQVEMRLDCFSDTRGQTEAEGVAVGDIIALDPNPEYLDNGFINSRYLDNKAGVACVLEALKLLQENALQVKRPVRILFTIAEEIGLGAGASLSENTGDMISVDISPSAPGQSARETGVTFGVKDGLGPHDRKLLEELEGLCEAHDIESRRDVFRHYHSDCSSAVRAGWDVRTALVTFGTDATHGYERTHISSLTAVSRLLLLAMTQA